MDRNTRGARGAAGGSLIGLEQRAEVPHSCPASACFSTRVGPFKVVVRI
jgi:hypothetical protein